MDENRADGPGGSLGAAQVAQALQAKNVDRSEVASDVFFSVSVSQQGSNCLC